jgi:hypothetical protein
LSNLIFVQLFDALRKRPASDLRRPAETPPFQLCFKAGGNELQLDARLCLGRICAELSSGEMPLFTRCRNGVLRMGHNQDAIVPLKISEQLSERMFEFVGVLIGVALRFELAFPIPLPRQLWKSLVGEDASDDDVFDIDVSARQFIGREMNRILGVSLTGRRVQSRCGVLGHPIVASSSQPPAMDRRWLSLRTVKN